MPAVHIALICLNPRRIRLLAFLSELFSLTSSAHIAQVVHCGEFEERGCTETIVASDDTHDLLLRTVRVHLHNLAPASVDNVQTCWLEFDASLRHKDAHLSFKFFFDLAFELGVVSALRTYTHPVLHQCANRRVPDCITIKRINISKR